MTVIAGLIAWVATTRSEYQFVHAQSAANRQYAVEVISAHFGTPTFQADLTVAINSAAKGRELVTILKHDLPGKYLAIYK
ncbi:MAG TPA: hypothetical protein VKE70_27095 [Candidatus Solibacter sp.]|nr:hypothetical protein [Candidatus Solibacter sp.]